jgi:hypothetical protein
MCQALEHDHVNLLESVYAKIASVRSGFRLPQQRDTLVHVGTARPSVIRSRHQARPGRRALVARDLDVLRGPESGRVELPVRLFWSAPDRHFDLDDDDQRAWLYETVLREASRLEDLTIYLNVVSLLSMWPQIRSRLPRGVRQAWEEEHPQLRAAADSRHTAGPGAAVSAA